MAPKILIFGPPRMGTQSIADSLEVLGYGPIYHMREVFKNGHDTVWPNLLHHKFDKTRNTPVDTAKLAEMLEKFDGIADFPASLFVSELLTLYPTAKIILTQRDETGWSASMSRTLISSYNNPDYDRTSPMQPLREAYHAYAWKNDFPSNGVAFKRQYDDEVRRLAGEMGREVLEFDVREGWAPLCGFLGKEVPDVPFRNNDEARGSKGEKLQRKEEAELKKSS